MPGDPKDCRQHAKNCWVLATEAKTPELKHHFTDLAQRWAELATDLETTQRLLAEFGDERLKSKADKEAC
jgi:hypothetical protein